MAQFPIFTIFLFLIIEFVDSAGIAVHLNVAYRNQINIPSQLINHQSEYFAGAFHPDAFYNCFGESLAAENAHWPPFLKAAINHYHNQYILKGLSNDPLKAFIYGLFTHQVADVSWHSLNSHQGLLQVLSNVEFNNNIDKAHTYLDTVGDFIILNRQFENLSNDQRKSLVSSLKVKWKYPIKDILNIYHDLGFAGITETKLNICMSRGYSALQGEITAVLTERSAKNRLNLDIEQSPLTVAILNNYYYGGIDQIINSLESCTKELNVWFSNEPYENPWDICKPLFKKHSINQSFNGSSSNLELKNINYRLDPYSLNILHFNDNNDDGKKMYLSSGIPNSKFGSSFNFGNFLNEPTIAISAPFEESIGSVYLVPLSEIIHDEEPIFLNKNYNSLKLTPSEKLNLSYPTRFGDKMFKWLLNNDEFLIISQPGISSLKVFYHGDCIAVLESKRTVVTLGEPGLKEWNILSDLSYDINSDGFPELIIGSMFSDNNNIAQNGLILALDGEKFYSKIINILNGQFSNSLLSLVPTIDIESIILNTFEVPSFLNQENGYEQFGTTFAATKNKILIGINSIGKIVVFNKQTSDYLGLLAPSGKFTDKHDKVLRSSSKKTALYGYKSILTGTLRGIEWILVSSIGYSYDNNCSLCGTVYLYSLIDDSINLVTKLIISKDIFEPIRKDINKFINSMFGSQLLKLSESLVIITSNGYDDGRGGLFLVNLEDILFSESIDEFTETELLFIGDSDIGFSNFGYDCIQSFAYENKLYLAISLSNYFFPQSINQQPSNFGSLLILDISENK